MVYVYMYGFYMFIEMGLAFEAGDVDENSNTVTWLITFHGVADARDIENRCLRKEDWAGIRLACGSKERGIPPWVGRTGIPNGSKANVPDYRTLQVNISGVRIMRIPHGIGVWKSLDRKSCDIYADKFYFFYGNYYTGSRLGYGIEVNDVGMYNGTFVENRREGRGRLDMANGTTIKGRFSTTFTFPEKNLSLDPRDHNPYGDGKYISDGV